VPPEHSHIVVVRTSTTTTIVKLLLQLLLLMLITRCSPARSKHPLFKTPTLLDLSLNSLWQVKF
jgi:hypothetical protein